MRKIFTKTWHALVITMLMVGIALPGFAQYTTKNLETNHFASAMAKDASGNIYVLHVTNGSPGGGSTGSIVKYTNGTGTASADLITGISDRSAPLDWATGMTVLNNGDIYYMTDNGGSDPSGGNGSIMKLHFNGSTWVSSTFKAGTSTEGFYTALTSDGTNLYAVEYNFNGNGNYHGIGSYQVVEFVGLSTTPTVRYDKLGLAGLDNALNNSSSVNYSVPTGLTIAPNGDIYVADGFSEGASINDGGKIIKLTAASSYAPTTISTGFSATALTLDASGNLFALQGTSTTVPAINYGLYEYVGAAATQSPTSVYTPLHAEDLYPYGLVIVNNQNIFVADGSDRNNAHFNAVMNLIGAPTTQASNITFSNTTEAATTINWTNGTGTSRAVFIKAATTGSPTLTNSTTYTANTTYANGTQAGTGWYCVYNGTGSTVNVTGLSTGTAYRVMVVDYNGSAGSENYNNSTSSTNNPNNVTTATNPVLTASGSAPAYNVGGSAVAIDGGITITNGTGTISTATVKVSTAFVAGDALNFINQNGITGTYNTGTGILTLSGSTTAANYQTALQSITFSSSASSTTTRVISFQVGDGTANSNTVTKNVTISTNATLSSLSLASSSPTNAGTVNFTATFSTPITGLTASNFSVTTTGVAGVTNASIGTVTGSGTTWTIPVSTGTGNGTIQLSMVNATNISPSVTTTLPFNGATYTIDKTIPTVAITRTDPSPIHDNVLDFQAVFSEAVTHVDPTDFVMTNSGVTTGAISVTSVNATTYNITVTTVAGNGTARLDVTAGTDITDAAGNAVAAYTGGEVYTVDQTAPTVSSIARANTNPTKATSVGFNVTFNEAVTGVDQNDFSLTTSGSASGVVTSVTGSGSTYLVTVSSVNGTGNLRLDLNTSGTGITDVAGNAISGGFTTGETYSVDNNAPILTSGSYITNNGTSIVYAKTGDVVTLSFGANESLQTPTVTLGGIAVTPVNVFGNVWNSTHTVTAADPDGHFPFAFTMTDLAGNSAPEISSATTGAYVTIDNTAPQVVISAPSLTDATTGSTVTYTVTYNEANFNNSALSNSDITLNTTGTANASVNLTGSGNTYTVTLTGLSGTGTLGISIGPNTATDLAGNSATASGASATFNVGPAVTASTLASLATCQGSASASQSFTVSGVDLTANVVVTPPAGIELSSDNSAFSTSSISLSPTAGAVNTTTLYARIAASASSAPTGSIDVSSTNAATQHIAVTATVNAVPTMALGTVSAVLTTDNAFSVPYTGTTGSPDWFSISTGTRALTNFTAISNNSLGSSPINVPLPSGLTAGTYDFNLTVTNSTTGCISAVVPFTLTINNPAPGVTVTSSINAFTACSGSASASQSFTVSGTFLTGNIVVTPPAGFEMSTTSNGTYSTSNITFTPTSGTVSTSSVYVRMIAGTSNPSNGNIQVASSGTSTQNVAVSGSFIALPSVTAGTVTPVLTSATTFDLPYSGATNSPDRYSITTGTRALSGFSTVNTFILPGSPISVNIPANSTAGTYDFNLTVSNNTTGCTSAVIPFTLTINNPTPTITFNTLASKTYGDADFDPAATSTNTVTAVTYGSSNTSVATIVSGKIHIVGVGNTTITASQAAGNGYNAAADVQQALSVSAMQITATADAQTKIYGQADPALTYQVTTGHLVSGDAFTGALTRATGENVGSYNITQGTLALSSNYALTYAGASLSITARTLTVTATAANKTYDGTNTATITLSDDRKAGDTFTTESYTTATFNDKNKGTGKTVSVNGIAISGGAAGNYVLAATTATTSADISVRALNVTAQTDTKVYDGTKTSSVAPVVDALQTGDAVSTAATQTFDTKNVGTGKTLTAAGLVINDGNSGNNYAVTYVTNTTGVISTRSLTVTAQVDTKAYDGTKSSAIAPNMGALQTGDVVTTAATQTFDTKNVGTGKTLTAAGLVINDGNSGNNYAVSYVTNTAGAITARSLTVTAQTDTKVYDGTKTSSVAPVVGALQTGDVVSTAPTQTFDTKTVGTGKTLTAAGLVINDGNSGNNYAVTYVTNTTGSITARGITVTAQADTKAYDGTKTSSVAPVVTGLQSGDVVTTAATQTFDTKNVGTGKTLTAAGLVVNDGNSGNNYSVSYVTNTTGAITAKALTVTAQADTKVYDGTKSSAVAPTVGALQTGDVVSTAATQTFDTKNVGTGKTLTAAGLVINDGNSGNNYTVTYVNNTSGAISSKGLTVTAQADTKAYDGTTTSAVAPTMGTLQTGDVVSTAATQTFDTKNVGTGKTLTAAGLVINDGNSGNNYTVTYVTNTHGAITARSLNVTAQADTKVYDGSSSSSVAPVVGTLQTGDVVTTAPTQTFDNKNVGTGKTLTAAGLVINDGNSGNNYSVNYVTNTNGVITAKGISIAADAKTKAYGDADPALTYQITAGALATGDAFTGALTRDAGENAGTYAIKQGTLALSSNYSLTYTGANFTITKAAVTVTADAQTKIYGQADPVLTYKITSGALVGSDAFTGALTRDAGENIGTYAIKQGTLTLGGNYTLTYAGANLTINKAAVTVTADALTKTYGQADPALTYKITSGALVGSDAFTGALTRDAGENVGAYAIKQGTLALNDNYTLTYAGANLTIGKAAVTVTADAQAKTYGQADPALTYNITSGALVGSDAFTGALTRDAGENVGAYAIKQGTLALSGNYTLTYAGANLTINKAALTVTADAQTKTYGQADPTLTYKITSGALVGSDAFTGALSRDAGENVGTYAIKQGTLALNGNYTLTYVGANLTINKATVTVTADALTKAYGQTDPALTYKITSGALVSGDAFTGALTRDAGENVGTYAIKQGTLALSTNYTLTYVGASLTITKATLTIAANNQTKVYGAANPTLTITYTGFANGDTQASLTTQPTIVTSATATSGVNTYPITVSGAASANYTIAYTQGTLTITKAPLTITADNKSRQFGVANPAFTVTYSGFVNSESASNLTTQPNVTSTATINSQPGSYPITASGAVSGNYSFTYVNGSLTIIPLTNANLNNLTVSTGTLAPVFSSAVTAYAFSVPYNVDRIIFTPTFDPTATARINGAAAGNGLAFNMPIAAGSNTINIVVTAQDGTTVKTYTVTVYRAIPPDAVSASNILTPNADGKNDTWVIKDINLYPNNTVTVYDRGGRVIYTKHGYNNDWDGTLRGAPLSEGTYYYTIDLGVQSGTIKGYITVLRSN